MNGAADLVVESTSPAGATVNYSITTTDSSDPAPNLMVTPPSGTVFPRGTTPVQCTAWDNMGNTNQSEFTVTVDDTTAPQITCPGNVTVVKTHADGAALTFQALTSDIGDTNVVVEYSEPPGGTFAPGTTRVDCTVTDASGNESTCSFDVTVVNADPGEITGFNATPNSVSMLFPTQTGVEYVIEYKNSLDEPNWQPLTVVVGDGNAMNINDPEPAEAQRFYRVRSP